MKGSHPGPVGAVCFAAALAVAAAGCGSDGTAAAEPTAVAGDEPIISWEEFRASAIVIPNEGLLVEGDLVFENEQDLYDYWREQLAGGQGEALTVKAGLNPITGNLTPVIWPLSQRFALTYCVSAGFSATQMAALLPALDAAAAAWSGMIGVAFQRKTVTGTCDANNDQVVFNVQPNTFTNAFFPDDVRTARHVNLDADNMNDAFMTDSVGRDLLGNITHELGHALGFRHEYIWNPTCAANDANTPFEQASSIQMTPYDQDSVMNYPIPTCKNPPGGGFHISLSDRYGSVLLYGLAPSLINVITSI